MKIKQILTSKNNFGPITLEKDNSFTTEDGSVYNFYIYDMEESAKRYLLNCIVNYFRCLKQIQSNDFGTLVLKVKG